MPLQFDLATVRLPVLSGSLHLIDPSRSVSAKDFKFVVLSQEGLRWFKSPRSAQLGELRFSSHTELLDKSMTIFQVQQPGAPSLLFCDTSGRFKSQWLLSLTAVIRLHNPHFELMPWDAPLELRRASLQTPRLGPGVPPPHTRRPSIQSLMMMAAATAPALDLEQQRMAAAGVDLNRARQDHNADKKRDRKGDRKMKKQKKEKKKKEKQRRKEKQHAPTASHSSDDGGTKPAVRRERRPEETSSDDMSSDSERQRLPPVARRLELPAAMAVRPQLPAPDEPDEKTAESNDIGAPHTRSLHILAPQLTAEDVSRVKGALIKDFRLTCDEHPSVAATIRLSLPHGLEEPQPQQLTDDLVADVLFRDWIRQRTEFQSTGEDGIFRYDFANLQPIDNSSDPADDSAGAHSEAATNGTTLPILKQEELAGMKQNVILLAMLKGDPDSLLMAIRYGPSAHLQELMSLLVNAIVRAPFWFGKHRQLLVEALQARMSSDPAVEQAMDFVRVSRSIRNHEEHKFSRLFPRSDNASGLPLSPVPESRASFRLGSGDYGALLYDDNSMGVRILQTFEKLCHKKLRRKGISLDVPTDTTIFHPFQSCGRAIRKLHVLDVFNTNAKPLLLEVTTDEKRHASAPPQASPSLVLPGVSKLILKAGDDLRQDVGVLSVFRAFNYFWQAEKLEFDGHPVEAHIYNCVAMSDKMGLIEFVTGCYSMTHVKTVAQNGILGNRAHINRLVATAAGSFMAAFILGIRDRHSDNVLVTKEGLMFHIDFGHILGDKVKMDAAAIAITPELQEVLQAGGAWKDFVNTCVLAFAVLRNNARALLPFITFAFSTFSNASNTEAFVRKKLCLDMNLANACKRIKHKVESAPKKTKTRWKNAVHAIALQI